MTTQHALTWPEIKDLRFLLHLIRSKAKYGQPLQEKPQFLAAVGRLEAVVARCQGERGIDQGNVSPRTKNWGGGGVWWKASR